LATLEPSPTAVYRGPFTRREATRLLWRAGFGPRPGQAARFAALGLDGAVASLTRPNGPPQLSGRPPHAAKGRPLDPDNVWGDDHCWWLDRMVRSDQQLVERMTLVWHSWFATSVEASNARLMIAQNEMMRSHALGNFQQLLLGVTCDPAMLLWLNGAGSTRYNPNENYGREMMELFTLGAGRGYGQGDVHQNALALTGFVNDWSDERGPVNFRFEPSLHDDRVKTIFGRRGRFDWRDSCELCVRHREHPSFMVGKLWGYFVAVPPPPRTLRALERAYVSGGFEVRPIVEAILRHPLFYVGPRMVVPPAVYCAGLLRATGQTITTDAWAWIGQQAGQLLFDPPNVAGWDYADWLDTSRWAGRLTAVNYALMALAIDPNGKRYPVDETPSQALASALRFWGDPALSGRARASLLAFSRRAQRGITADWEAVTYRILRQNALRALIPTTPEWQTC
jgi:uncharacterized protein (DUF1800 family)